MNSLYSYINAVCTSVSFVLHLHTFHNPSYKLLFVRYQLIRFFIAAEQWLIHLRLFYEIILPSSGCCYSSFWCFDAEIFFRFCKYFVISSLSAMSFVNILTNHVTWHVTWFQVACEVIGEVSYWVHFLVTSTENILPEITCQNAIFVLFSLFFNFFFFVASVKDVEFQ